MNKFLEKLKTTNVYGVHLIMAGDNIGAEVFYRKLGFSRFPVVLDDGKSGELGKEAENHNSWLVREV